jgi:2-amino-4-hydroxy-6-hydroxymethyldihydropteridine diphosphokinase
MEPCLIALGANLGDKHQTLQQAILAIQETAIVDVIRTSQVHETLPVGGPAGQPTFGNAAILAHSHASAEEILRFLLELEQQFGRHRLVRWQARTLDLDLLIYGSQIISQAEFILPHPRMSFRRFVLEPAVEVAADLRHPVVRLTIGQLLARINEPEKRICLRSSSEKQLAAWSEMILAADPQWTLSTREPSERAAIFSEIQLVARAPRASDVAETLSNKQVTLAVAAVNGNENPEALQQLVAKESLFPDFDAPLLVIDLSEPQQSLIEFAAAIEAMR